MTQKTLEEEHLLTVSGTWQYDEHSSVMTVILKGEPSVGDVGMGLQLSRSGNKYSFRSLNLRRSEPHQFLLTGC